jgi:hypothetical protein
MKKVYISSKLFYPTWLAYTQAPNFWLELMQNRRDRMQMELDNKQYSPV